MANGRHVGKYWKCNNSPTNGPTGTKLGWSHPITFLTCPPWCGCHGIGRCLPSVHSTFSSYGRLEAERVNQFWWNLVHDSKLRKTSVTVIWSNIKIFKIEDGVRPPCWKILKNTIIRLPMDWLGHLYHKTFSLVLVVTAKRNVNFLVLLGVVVKNITILMKLGWVCVILVQKSKIWYKTANINTKTLEVLSLFRPNVQWHIWNSKNHLVSSSTSLGHGCNIWLLLHPLPSGVLEETEWFLLF